MKDGIRLRLPVPVRLLNGQTPKKLAPPLEERLQRRNEQRLAEAARTRKEVDPVRRRLRDFVDLRRLVDIHKPPPNQRREVVDRGVDRFQLCRVRHDMRIIP